MKAAGFLVFALSVPSAEPQGSPSAPLPDSVRVSTGNPAAAADSSGEMLLDEIEIQGHVEKPGVIIVPQRIEPEIKDIELKRSFEEELKNAGDAPRPDEKLGKVEQVESIKKAVERKRK
ncbi:hypothetical protein JW906_13530 [bacterium]|nr:hypothetical protein [bacterium]